MGLRLHAFWLAIALHAGAIWAAVGPLVGVLIGSLLTARSQRKQWLYDKKQAEYREVLDALQVYRWRLLNRLATILPAGIVAVGARTDKEEREAVAEAEVSLNNILADRLFIRGALEQTKVREDLRKFRSTLAPHDENSISHSSEVLGDLHRRIVDAAERDLNVR